MKIKKIFSILLTTMLLAGTLLLSSVTAFAGEIELPIVTPSSAQYGFKHYDFEKNANGEIVIRFLAFTKATDRTKGSYFIVKFGDYTSEKILAKDCPKNDGALRIVTYTLKDAELQQPVEAIHYSSENQLMDDQVVTAEQVANYILNTSTYEYQTDADEALAREVLARIEGSTKTKVAIPTAVTGLIYNGEEQTGVAEAEGYTVENGKATAADNYTAIATLKDGYIWSDFTEDAKEIQWSIEKKTAAIPTDVTGLVYNGKEQTGVAEAEGYTVTGGKATAVGTYTATATLKDGYVWSDKTEAPKNIEWSIDYAVAPAQAGFNNSGIQSITDENGIGTIQFGWTLTFEGSAPTSLGALIINWDAFNPEINPDEVPQESELIPLKKPVELSKANPNINSGEIFFARLTDIPANNTETITAYPTVNGKAYTAAKLSGTVGGTIIWVEEETINE